MAIKNRLVPLIGSVEKVRFNQTKSGRIACFFSVCARADELLAGLCRSAQREVLHFTLCSDYAQGVNVVLMIVPGVP